MVYFASLSLFSNYFVYLTNLLQDKTILEEEITVQQRRLNNKNKTKNSSK